VATSQPGPGPADSGNSRRRGLGAAAGCRVETVATVTAHTAAPPTQVYATLSQGWLFTTWVVGTSHMRAVDADWPAVGARLHHASGVWPALVRDVTTVEQAHPDRQLVLLAKGGLLGAARITIDISPDGSGSTLTLTETPVSGPGTWVNNPLTEAITHRRNTETLTRLTALVERRTQPET